MFLADGWKDFEVLDTGEGEKLERWGDILLARPDPQVIWPRENDRLWQKAQAHYTRSERGGGAWEFREKLPDKWVIAYRDLKFYVRPTGFKHTGLFPEQAANWDAMAGMLKQRPGAKVLNLFAYTGGASLACAAAGAHVTHVDAAKGMVLWAKENRELSGLPETSFRFIVEDALAFVKREIRRGSKYDGVVMDPPSYGRGPTGEVWKLEAAGLRAKCGNWKTSCSTWWIPAPGCSATTRCSSSSTATPPASSPPCCKTSCKKPSPGNTAAKSTPRSFASPSVPAACCPAAQRDDGSPGKNGGNAGGNRSLENLIRPCGPPSPKRGRLRAVSPRPPSEKAIDERGIT